MQRFVLSGLNGAACRLHTTREELVLSFVPAAGTKQVRWDRKTIDAALKAGFQQAIADTEHRGVGGYVVGHILDVIVGAPLDFLLDAHRLAVEWRRGTALSQPAASTRHGTTAR